MGFSIPQMALISQLLDEALPLDEAGRRAWLDGLSPEHRDLAPALRDVLLSGAAQAASFKNLSTLPKLGDHGETSAPAASGLEPGAAVGPYELIRLLGSGGMAEVWLARRADGAFKREVALKVPMLTHQRADLEPRFVRERDILASLEHPYIARFYDAGIAPSALRYVAMEYVRGQSLTAWCAAEHLGITERLRLFLQVLEAVGYAHERQIIHRDLKPSNILVTEAGQVRLLDFGVAKLLEAEGADLTPLTSVYGRALTPDYASPELLRGDVIDERSDLYSLGVLLYELLTGTRPYRLKGAASIGALDQAIATLEVKKPSTQLEPNSVTTGIRAPEQWARQVRGDLDAIVIKALAKNPTQRYASAAALAEDLQRYLEGKPTQAHPAGAPYRVRKFLLRNAAVAGVSAIAAAAILAAVMYTLHREARVQVTVAANAARIPAAARVEAALATFAPPEHSVAVLPFLDMSEKKDQEYFSDGLAEELLDLLAKIPGLHVVARTSSFSFKGKSDDIPTIAKKLNVANLLEGSVRKSGDRVRVTTQLIRAADGEGVWSDTYDRDIKDVFKVQDEIAGAVVSALKIRLAPGQQSSNSYRTSNLEAYNEYLLGRQLFDQFTLDGFRRAAVAYRRATGLDPRYAAAYSELAMSEFFAADWSRDEAGRKRSLEDANRAVALAPDQAGGYAARGHIRVEGAWDWAGAQADFEKALSIEPANSMALRRYALLIGALGRLPEAIAMTRSAIELDPLSGVTWTNLGCLLLGDGQLVPAHDAIQRAVEIQPDSPYGLHALGILRLIEGQPGAAMELAGTHGSEHFRLQFGAMAQHSLGDTKAATLALQGLIAKFGNDSAYDVAETYAWSDRKTEAFEWLERSFQRHESDLVSIKYDPIMNALRGDPRYKTLLRGINLPEE
jgi:TolB-like protein/tRNA A-37 threonylcarbamoyl transferase component Bud32/Tfp pilus assembly protein PilF